MLTRLRRFKVPNHIFIFLHHLSHRQDIHLYCQMLLLKYVYFLWQLVIFSKRLRIFVANMEKEITTFDNIEYQKWRLHLFEEIDKQRLKAVMQLNAATLQHYWWLGNDIIQKQKEQGWGAKVIDRLAADLQKRYGGDSGYSIRNLKYMRQFADEYPDFPFVQVPLAQITWYHHISLNPKVKDVALRAFYMTESAIQGWSRDIMLMQIEDDSNTGTMCNYTAVQPPCVFWNCALLNITI